MKKKYNSPYLEVEIMDETDVLTNSGTLSDNEFENEDQWWITNYTGSNLVQ